jgi:hypothetical protein
MKRLLLLLIPSLSLAGTTVTPGTWDVYSGTSRVASETTEAACIERGKAMKLAKFGCRTITTVIVTADPVPEPPVVVPPVIVPEPPKPPVTGQPGPSNTGPTSKTLTSVSGAITLNKSGVYEGFFRTGSILVTAPNVTIRNFRLNGNGADHPIKATDAAVKGLVIEDGEIYGCGSICIYGHDWTGRRLYIHDSGADGVRPTGNVVFENSWVEKVGSRAGSHADVVQMLEGSHVTFRGNFFDIPFDDTKYMNSACFMIQRDKGAVDDITVEGNWLRGGDFCIRFTGGVTNYRVRNNKMLGKHEYGPFGKELESLPPASFCGNVDANGKLFASNKACQ